MKRALFLCTFILAGLSLTGQKRMIDQIREFKNGTCVWWAGNDSWIIKSDGLVIATDLFLEDGDRVDPLPVTAEELAPVLDISFITHGHGDHFNEPTSKVLLAQSKCTFVLPESCLETARKINIPGERIVIARPRTSIEVKGVKADVLRAIHGNMDFAIYYDANLQDCGYVFNLAGKTFLQPGDTYLLEDHLFLKHVDVLFFSPTEHNMYIDPSVILINRLNPDYIFPQHHSTMRVADDNYWWTRGYQGEVYIRLSEPLKKKYHILKMGGSMKID